MRIAIPVLARHITSLGGIGFFVSSWVDLMDDGKTTIDLICDKPVKKENIKFANLRELNIRSPKEPLSYGYSQKMDMFMGLKTPIELYANFQRAMIESLEDVVYDWIFVNSFEALPGILHSNIDKICPVTLYTHDAGFFADKDRNFNYGVINGMAESFEHTITQSAIGHGLKSIPMPHIEYPYFYDTPAAPEVGTAYYCGSWAQRKRPDLFIEFCKKYDKKALVITNEKGKKNFEDAFTKLGIPHEVRTNIFGVEKAEFIARGEMMFFPSEEEYFPYAVLEALFFMPVYISDKNNWSHRFVPHWMELVKGIDWAPVRCDLKKQREWVEDYFEQNNQVWLWLEYIKSRKIEMKPSTSKTKELIGTESLSVSDLWKKVGRDVVSFTDGVTLYKIARENKLFHTKEKTYFNDLPGENTQEETALDAFFN